MMGSAITLGSKPKGPLVLTGAGAGGGASSTLLSGLVMYYKLEEATGNARVDSTGGTSLTENGTVNNAVGKLGNGADFANNTSNYLSRANGAVVDRGDTDYTFRCWFKLSSVASVQLLFSLAGASDYGYFAFFDTNRIEWQVGDGGGNIIGTVNTGIGSVVVDTWYYLTLYHDAAGNRVGAQINNGTITWAATTGTAGSSAAAFQVGRWAVDTSLPLRGVMDELALWSRILTSDETTTDYNGGVGKTHPFDGSAVLSYTRVNATMGSGQTVRTLVPSSYAAETPTTLIMYHHGVNEDETDIENSDKFNVVWSALQQSWLVGAAYGGSNNWGSQTGIDNYNEYWTHLNATYNINRVVFLSQSMGGLTGLLCIADGTIPVDGWYGIFPVCSLADMFAGNTGTFAAEIRARYGIAADGSDYASKTAGHDPLLLAASTFDGLPMRFTASAGDTVVSKTANSDAMKTLVTGHATEHTVVVCSGDHGDASHFQPSDFVSFVGRC